MSRRPASHVFLIVASLGATLLAGCASRSLNAPPVVDWSNGGQAARAPDGLSPAAPVPRYYTVRRQDTLASIARQFGTTPAELAQWNGLGPNPAVRVDQVLRVNAPTVAATPPDAGSSAAVTKPIGAETVEQRTLGGSAPSMSAVPPPVPAGANVPDLSGPLGVKRPYSDAALAELSRPDRDAVATSPPAGAAPTVPPPAGSAANPTSTPAPTVVWGWPVSGKPSTAFGDGKTKGIDIPGKAGEPVLAAADGAVTFAGDKVHGYGNFVIIRHTPQLLSVYAHNRTNLVAEGAVVKKGQKIAEMGDTDADAVKLHFEIRNDSKPVDPLKFLPER